MTDKHGPTEDRRRFWTAFWWTVIPVGALSIIGAASPIGTAGDVTEVTDVGAAGLIWLGAAVAWLIALVASLVSLVAGHGRVAGGIAAGLAVAFLVLAVTCFSIGVRVVEDIQY